MAAEHDSECSRSGCSGSWRPLRRGGLSCSMSRAGNSHHNAVAESFFGALEIELFADQSTSPARNEARSAIHDHIDVFYNRERRHSTIGCLSSVECEARCDVGAAYQAT